jgi:hypothetical protein
MSSEIAEELSRQTRDLISRFEERANSFSRRQDLAGLTVPGDPAAAERTARSFFGKGEHIATGIDGSMDFDERLQMILFYANATAYSCPFTVEDRVKFDLNSAHRESKLAASAAIPLWAEDLGNVFSREPEVDIELEHSMERVPNSFMALGELYLAVQLCGKSKIIFLDRPLSGTFSTLSRDARLVLRRGESKLTTWPEAGYLTMIDLYLGVNLGAPTMSIPARRQFLHVAIIRELLTGEKSIGELATALGVTEGEGKKAIARIREVEKNQGGKILAGDGTGKLTLHPGLADFWKRIEKLALAYAKDAFSGKRHPLALGGEEYLTIIDVNTVTLFLLEILLQKAKETGTLVIGIAKDTTATDISRAVLPYASASGRIRLSEPAPRLKNDRAFLAILSSENPSIKTPWRTLGYDSAFSTIIQAGDTFKSARKVVSREDLFVRSYFQLRSLKSDPAVRSQVFLFDRAYESADSENTAKLIVEERSGPTEVRPYIEGSAPSSTSNLVLHILSLTDNPEVFEAFGHNQLLYLADKAVKAEVKMMRSSLRGVADLRVGGVSRRRKIFGLVTTYREQRAEAEHARGR